MQKAFVRHTADLVDAAMDVRNRSAPLCMDQDIYADLAVANPTLFEWFTTSGDGYGWGWKDGEKRNEHRDEMARFLIAKSEEDKILGFTHFKWISFF